jgi:hypothetical protein
VKYTSALALLLFLLFSHSAYALRCGHALVQVGDRKHDVVKKCGKPDAIDEHSEVRAVQNSATIASGYSNNALKFGQRYYGQIDISVEEWTYDFGRSRFQQLLRFENGVLTDITELGRGD